MAKSQKVSGYLVKIEAFVPADLTDSGILLYLQQWSDRASAGLAAEHPGATIDRRLTPIRR